MVVVDFIIDNLGKNSQKEAVIFKEKVYKYSYILEKYNNWLEYVDTNIGKNEVVAIQSEYNPQSIALLLALIERKCNDPIPLIIGRGPRSPEIFKNKTDVKTIYTKMYL